MYGLIVKLTSIPGRRSDLIRQMGGSDSHTIAGCLSFIVAADAADDDVLWITEVWENRASHEASLNLAPVEEGLGKAETLIAHYKKIATTEPVQGSSHPLHGES